MQRAKIKHILGLRGQFFIPPLLQNTAHERGISIENIGGGRFRVSARNQIALANMTPGITNQDHVYDREGLYNFLNFLHQPLKIASKDHGLRVIAHRTLRLCTTGSVQMPGDDSMTPRHKHLEEDEHVDVENAIKTDDSWHTVQEFNPGNWDGALPGMLPRSSFDADNGFFHFYPAQERKALTPAQRQLDNAFWLSIAAATNNRHGPADEKVTLSAREIEKFCAELGLRRNALEALLLRAEYEEQVDAAIQNVGLRRRKIEIEKGTEQSKPLSGFLKSSSALTPIDPTREEICIVAAQLSKIVHSDAALASWKRYHFLDRNDSPLPNLVNELSILQATLERSKPEDAAAIAEEFKPILSFARSVFDSMEKSAAKNKIKLGNDFLRARESSLSFDEEVSNQKYREVAHALHRGLGLEGAIKQTWDVGTNSMKGFLADMWNFGKEKPIVFAAAAAVAVYLYYNGTGVVNPEIAKIVAQIPPDSVMVPGMGGLEAMPSNINSLPEAARLKQNWHLDGNMVRWVINLMRGEYNPVGTFKHYTFDIFVSNPSHALMNGIDTASQWAYNKLGIPYDPAHQFAKVANETVDPWVNKLFSVNVLQNATHASWWMFMFGKGLHVGMRGATRLAKLMAPAVDLVAASGLRTTEFLRIKDNPRLVEGLLAGAVNANGIVPKKQFAMAAKDALTNKWALAVYGTTAASVLLASAGNPDTAAMAARIAGYTGTTGIFAGYNFYDDIFLNHIVGGLSLLATGAGLRFAYQKAAGPVIRWTHEGVKKIDPFSNDPPSPNPTHLQAA